VFKTWKTKKNAWLKLLPCFLTSWGRNAWLSLTSVQIDMLSAWDRSPKKGCERLTEKKMDLYRILCPSCFLFELCIHWSLVSSHEALLPWERVKGVGQDIFSSSPSSELRLTINYPSFLFPFSASFPKLHSFSLPLVFVSFVSNREMYLFCKSKVIEGIRCPIDHFDTFVSFLYFYSEGVVWKSNW